ncbi:ABC transporter substrate-binding protein, partial [Enterococcus faecalis]|uniref:ABC transporter substrate-binding protein n=1 Tax=Enterococcus faecalis TaxID=1351 RepID=UPI0010036013
SFYLEMNQADEKSPLTNANLRRAMSYAIDRDSLAKNIARRKFALVNGDFSSSFYLEMNQADEKSPLTNANLRRAMSYAIDRDSLAKNILANG